MQLHFSRKMQMSDRLFTYKGVKFYSAFHSQEYLSIIENEFQAQDDDVYIVSYPKSGTNWMIEIVSLLKMNGDPTWCNSVPIWLRSPRIEFVFGQSETENVTLPRVLSSHLPFHIFAKSVFTSKAKIIYMMRNPKDILVSSFHFSKMLCPYDGPKTFAGLFEEFLHGDIAQGSWFDHVKGWMQMKDNKNFFYITYEELYQDFRGSVVKMCAFLGKELSEEQMDLVVHNASFETMKDNKMSNYSLYPPETLDQTKGSLIRKGITGDWKNHFTVAQNEHFDEIYQEKMKDFNFKFFWENA